MEDSRRGSRVACCIRSQNLGDGEVPEVRRMNDDTWAKRYPLYREDVYI